MISFFLGVKEFIKFKVTEYLTKCQVRKLSMHSGKQQKDNNRFNDFRMELIHKIINLMFIKHVDSESTMSYEQQYQKKQWTTLQLSS
jgi:hypothetical protein